LGGNAQDARVLGEVCLGQGCNHAPGAGTGDAQPQLITDLGGVADPGILSKAAFRVGCLHDDVRSESAHLETAGRIQLAQPIAEALNSPAVISAVHSFAAGAHQQIFQINRTAMSDAAATSAATTIKTTLEAVDPKLAGKLPDNVLDATTNISCVQLPQQCPETLRLKRSVARGDWVDSWCESG
jgi:hypothetical protein